MTFLETADRLGARLCRDALWHGERCTWLSDFARLSDQRGDQRIAHGPVGPDVYTGVAGIALFLGSLARATGEPIYASTAQGALAQAIQIQHRVAPEFRAGFYRGWSGIAWVLGCAGRLEQALNLVRQITPAAGAESDLMNGPAGAVAALVALARAAGDDTLLELAIEHGDLLIASAQPDATGLSWPWPRAEPGGRNLTGFSHGAAGIGWALLELGEATGESRFSDAAAASFRYEQRLFDQGQGNWPDHRYAPPKFSRAWCHGAGGIGFSRLRAWQLSGDPAYRAEAEIALAAVEPGVAAPNLSGFSLCHGVAGNADLLLYAQDVLGRPAPAAAQAATVGAAHFEAQRVPWAGGLAGRDTPGLMLGTAGIGNFYLRLAQPGLHVTPLMPVAG